MTRLCTLAACAFALASALATSPARADDRRTSITALLGGAVAEDAPRQTSFWRFGAGVQGGYRSDWGGYLGARAMLRVGSKEVGGLNWLHYYAVTPGFEARVGRVYLRPTLIAGVAFVRTPLDEQGGFVSPLVGLRFGAGAFVGSNKNFRLGVEVDAAGHTDSVRNGDFFFNTAALSAFVAAGYRF